MTQSTATSFNPWLPCFILYTLCVAHAGALQVAPDVQKLAVDRLTNELQAHVNFSSRNGTVLLVVSTTNVWHRTETLLQSLTTVTDAFDLLFVDECSTDGTREKLKALGVKTIYVDEASGVTKGWNLAYSYFLKQGYQHIIYSNNDVLIPQNAISKLVIALENARCELITPLSTRKGKGHKGASESIEVLYDLDDKLAAFVQQPANYKRVQSALDFAFGQLLGPVIPTNVDLPKNPGMYDIDFNGFFFAIRRDAAIKVAFEPGVLFNPANIQVDQEADLSKRFLEQKMRICLHGGSFVFHFKASTIPMGDNSERTSFRAGNASKVQEKGTENWF